MHLWATGFPVLEKVCWLPPLPHDWKSIAITWKFLSVPSHARYAHINLPGGSARKMVQWMKPLQDPSRLIFTHRRCRKQPSGTYRSRGFCRWRRWLAYFTIHRRAYAVNYGNSSIGHLPTFRKCWIKQWFQRGTRTLQDWWEFEPSPILSTRIIYGGEKLKRPCLFCEHEEPFWLSILWVPRDGPRIWVKFLSHTENPGRACLGNLWKNWSEAPTQEHAFMPNCIRTSKNLSFLSSRDIRNIQVPFPCDWRTLICPRLVWTSWCIFQKDYDSKVRNASGIDEIEHEGLSFSDIRRQEVIRYLDNNVATIADTDFKRKVDQRVHELNVQLEARRILNKRNDGQVKGSGIVWRGLGTRIGFAGTTLQWLSVTLGYGTHVTFQVFPLTPWVWSPWKLPRKSKNPITSTSAANAMPLSFRLPRPGKTVPFHSFDCDIMEAILLLTVKKSGHYQNAAILCN